MTVTPIVRGGTAQPVAIIDPATGIPYAAPAASPALIVGTGVTSTTPANVANVQLVALNTSRSGITVWNKSAASLYIRFGAVAAAIVAGSWNEWLKPGARLSMDLPIDTRAFQGIWDAADASGYAEVTEY